MLNVRIISMYPQGYIFIPDLDFFSPYRDFFADFFPLFFLEVFFTA